MNTIAIAPEIDSLKARLKETWMAGDYDRFSRYMEQGARIFYEQLDVPAGCQLLDVACGSGQVALWAWTLPRTWFSVLRRAPRRKVSRLVSWKAMPKRSLLTMPVSTS